jgi:hypothetical protein
MMRDPWVVESDEIHQIAAEVEALAPRRALGAMLVDTMTASQRADVLDSYSALICAWPQVHRLRFARWLTVARAWSGSRRLPPIERTSRRRHAENAPMVRSACRCGADDDVVIERGVDGPPRTAASPPKV